MTVPTPKGYCNWERQPWLTVLGRVQLRQIRQIGEVRNGRVGDLEKSSNLFHILQSTQSGSGGGRVDDQGVRDDCTGRVGILQHMAAGTFRLARPVVSDCHVGETGLQFESKRRMDAHIGIAADF